ncbi:MAG: hypothetical protein ACLQGP_33010 [Isosphaeraceae bacterium]
MTCRTRPYLVPGLFILILFNLACSGFFQVYWLKDNQWALDPRDLSVRWLSDADYRALQASTASQYTTTDGRTFVLSPDPDERKASLALHQIGTPDGQWHGSISTRLATHTFGVWFGVALPVFVICVVGLVVSLPSRKKEPVDPLADAGV